MFVLSTVLDASLQKCVEILDGYITELRGLMKKFPWPPGANAPPSVTSHGPDTERRGEEEWNFLTTEVRKGHACTCKHTYEKGPICNISFLIIYILANMYMDSKY